MMVDVSASSQWDNYDESDADDVCARGSLNRRAEKGSRDRYHTQCRFNRSRKSQPSPRGTSRRLWKPMGV